MENCLARSSRVKVSVKWSWMYCSTGATYDTCFIAGQIIEGRLPAIATAADTAARADEIAISRTQKEKMKLKVGDKVLTYFVSDRIRMRPLKIVGVYETHLSGFDNHIVWTDKRLVDRLNNWTTAQCASLEIMLDHFESIEAVQPHIKHIVDRYAEQNGSAVATLSVKENPRTAAVVQWLSLLDFNVWVILILMAGVAGFTMTTGYHTISSDKSVCMALVKVPHNKLGTPLEVQIRKKTFPGVVVKKKFYEKHYKKN